MTETQFHWPNVRRSIYNMAGPSVDSSTKCFVNHTGSLSFRANYIGDQYKRAADLIIEAKVNGLDPFHPDGLFMPVGFLYRHSLELKLKSILTKIVQCNLLKNNKGKCFHGHNILNLWHQIRPVIINRWPNADQTPLDNVESLLNELNEIDKSGQNFRYSETTLGQDTSKKFPQIIRLDILKDAFDEIYNLLDGCAIEFDSMQQLMCENHNEHE